jgi:hypothetical protein
VVFRKLIQIRETGVVIFERKSIEVYSNYAWKRNLNGKKIKLKPVILVDFEMKLEIEFRFLSIMTDLCYCRLATRLFETRIQLEFC